MMAILNQKKKTNDSKSSVRLAELTLLYFSGLYANGLQEKV
jgi:hypothetical protein